MEKLLTGIAGKRADIFCGGSIVFRGRIESVKDGLVYIVDENERLFHIVLDHVVAVSEVSDAATKPGFRS